MADRFNRKSIEKKKDKSDREENHHPKTKPKARALIPNNRGCLLGFKCDSCEKKG